MKNNRRSFLKYTGLSGPGIAVGVIPKAFAIRGYKNNKPRGNGNFVGRLINGLFALFAILS